MGKYHVDDGLGMFNIFNPIQGGLFLLASKLWGGIEGYSNIYTYFIGGGGGYNVKYHYIFIVTSLSLDHYAPVFPLQIISPQRMRTEDNNPNLFLVYTPYQVNLVY